MTCKKAQGFLEQHHTVVHDISDATKQKIDRDRAIDLIAGMERIVAAKGKKIDILELNPQPDEAAILALLLGPTGNLRAPTAKVGTTLLVGFNDEAYEQVLGS